jgi:hypothetical protein
MKSRVATALLTGHNTLRRHLYIMGLTESLVWEERSTGGNLISSFVVSV